VAFAPQGRVPGPNPFTLIDQGPGLVAVVDVLQSFIDEFPQSTDMCAMPIRSESNLNKTPQNNKI
jgi:hypothetical protein